MALDVEGIVKKYSYVGMSGALVKMLQQSLYSSEEPLYAHNGLIRKGKDEMEGIILVTTLRVLCCSRQIIAKELDEIPLLKIQSMQIVKGKRLIQRELHIKSLTDEIIKVADVPTLRKLQYAVQLSIDNYNKFNNISTNNNRSAATTITMQATQPSKDVNTQLRELKQLCDEGIITQEEFAAKKKQLLGL